jgi:hypothetical protein
VDTSIDLKRQEQKQEVTHFFKILNYLRSKEATFIALLCLFFSFFKITEQVSCQKAKG